MCVVMCGCELPGTCAIDRLKYNHLNICRGRYQMMIKKKNFLWSESDAINDYIEK